MLANLFAVKLRNNGRTTRLITKCCYSALALDHPYYDGNVICVHANACVLAAPNIEPLSRIFTEDWDPLIDGEMPPVTASLEDSETMWKKFASFIKRPVQERSGITLQHVFAQLRPPTILGLSEGRAWFHSLAVMPLDDCHALKAVSERHIIDHASCLLSPAKHLQRPVRYRPAKLT